MRGRATRTCDRRSLDRAYSSVTRYSINPGAADGSRSRPGVDGSRVGAQHRIDDGPRHARRNGQRRGGDQRAGTGQRDGTDGGRALARVPVDPIGRHAGSRHAARNGQLWPGNQRVRPGHGHRRDRGPALASIPVDTIGRHAGSRQPRRNELLRHRCADGHAINALGQVTGQSMATDGNYHAYRWTVSGGMRDLGTLGGPESHGNDINALGQVTGAATTGDGHARAFRWTPSGGMQDLGTARRTAGSNAVAINDLGQVTGDARPRSGLARVPVDRVRRHAGSRHARRNRQHGTTSTRWARSRAPS